MQTIQVLLLLSFLGMVYTDHLASEYDHFVALDPLQKMKLYWSVDRGDKSISFAVEANTTGWVGFGFSAGTGRMKGADVVIGWVKDGKAKLTNRHAVGQSLPLMDDNQSTYTLLAGTEANGKTTLKFSRKLDTCSNDDRKIEEGTTKVIFAYHDEDPEGDNQMLKHSYRGARSLLLLNYGKKTEPDSTWSKMDMLMNNVSLSVKKTSYICQMFKVPDLPGKRHITRFEPVVQPGNEGFVHHFVVSECHAEHNVTFSNTSIDCLDYANMPSGVMQCKGLGEIVAAWGVGGGAFIYPDHAGYPIGTPDSGKIYIMETHYDNPENVQGRYDSSGVRFYYTDKIRRYDAGTFTVGQGVSSWMVIPPKQDSWIVEGHCPHDCSQKVFENSTLPGKGINVFAIFLHTHLAGRGTWTKHFRNGVELPEIARDNYYDFNFQEIQALPKERHIKPGDDLIHYCKYNTMDRSKATYGGDSTYDEMCLAFMLYYPRVPIKFCTSSDIAPTYKFLSKNWKIVSKFASIHYNTMQNINITWTVEKATELKTSIQEAKRVRVGACPRLPLYYNITRLAEGNILKPKVTVTKPLGPPVSDCDTGSAHALRGDGVLSVVLGAWLLLFVALIR